MGSSTVQPTAPGATATTASAGLMSAALVRSGIGQLVMLETPVIDWTAAAAAYSFNDVTGAVPSYPGFYFGVVKIDGTMLSTSGTLSVQATWSVGNDPSFVNVQGSNSSSLATPFATGAPVIFALLSGNLNTARVVDAANPMKISVTAPASGAGLVLTVKYSMVAMLIPHS